MDDHNSHWQVIGCPERGAPVECGSKIQCVEGFCCVYVNLRASSQIVARVNRLPSALALVHIAIVAQSGSVLF